MVKPSILLNAGDDKVKLGAKSTVNSSIIRVGVMLTSSCLSINPPTLVNGEAE